mmetsp:Transcript_106888/g.297657  ORF Transcript_106888/g.297657 Transcript_106888/m.297657 type:complete len:219 (+) Transcript_106888:222-878(+)
MPHSGPGFGKLHLEDQVVVPVAVQLVDRLLRVFPGVIRDEREAPRQASVHVLRKVHSLQPAALPEEVLQVTLPAILREVCDSKRGLLLLRQVGLALALAVALAALLLVADAGRHVPAGALPSGWRFGCTTGALCLLFALLHGIANRGAHAHAYSFLPVQLFDAVHVGPNLLLLVQVCGKLEAVFIELVLSVIFDCLHRKLLRDLNHHFFMALHTELCL